MPKRNKKIWKAYQRSQFGMYDFPETEPYGTEDINLKMIDC